MVVIDKRKTTCVTFRTLKIGETFLSPTGDLCLKIAPLWDEDEQCFNTVRLRTGLVTYSSDFDAVIEVAATVTYTDIE